MLTLDLGNTSTQHAPPILKRLAGIANPHMVEVGVLRGKLSNELLRSRTDLSLWMVDPWREMPVGSPGRDFAYQTGEPCGSLTQTQHDDNRACAQAVAEQYPGRAYTVPSDSAEAAGKLPIAYRLDLVFLDGGHWQDQVAADIAAWWPRVKPGGWLGGHDYKVPGFGNGVAAAVDHWAESGGLPVELDAFFTWFVRKPHESEVRDDA